MSRLTMIKYELICAINKHHKRNNFPQLSFPWKSRHTQSVLTREGMLCHTNMVSLLGLRYWKTLSCRQTLKTNTNRFHHHSELSIEWNGISHFISFSLHCGGFIVLCVLRWKVRLATCDCRNLWLLHVRYPWRVHSSCISLSPHNYAKRI